MGKESKEVFISLETLSKKLELDSQEDNFTEPLAMQHEELTNENLMESVPREKVKIATRRN